jgi:hypothetical protein
MLCGPTVTSINELAQRKPGLRREAAARGAQLSTNDMLELVDNVVKYLGENG